LEQLKVMWKIHGRRHLPLAASKVGQGAWK
jgi:hypothetical protein